MRDQYRNMISGAFVMLLSILYFAGTFTFIEISRHSAESKFLPRVYATMLFFIALQITVKAARKWKLLKTAAGEQPDKSGEKANYLRVVATLVLIAIYAYLFQKIGFVSATFLYLAVHMLVLAGGFSKKPATIIAVSAGTALCLYYLFVHIFQIAFPYGLLF